mgnify:FL=1|nr:MAG TPA: hypothetical protein [Caudoviricetes sp.]
MTGVRYSIAIAKESGIGTEATTGWVSLPPGSFMSSTHNVSTNTVFGAGSKYFNTQSYGRVSLSWEYTFVLDYDNLAPLLMIFDTYDFSSNGDGKSNTHSLSFANNKRPPTFTIKRKYLNRITAAPNQKLHDETYVMTGCVAKSLRISWSNSSSQANVTISGFALKDYIDTTDLSDTDFEEYDGDLAEFACLFIGDNYVANVESLTIGIDLSTVAVYTTCTPFPVNYYAGTISNQFGFTCYSNDPLRYKALVYTGGQDVSNAKDGTTAKYTPMCKKKAPIPQMHVKIFNTCKKDGEAIADTVGRATKSIMFDITDCIVKSATWQKGDGGRLLDQMSSAECKKIGMTIVNDHDKYF